MIDVEAAMKILESPPTQPANRSPEDVEAAFRITEEIDSVELSESEPTDASENLDKYVYG